MESIQGGIEGRILAMRSCWTVLFLPMVSDGDYSNIGAWEIWNGWSL